MNQLNINFYELSKRTQKELKRLLLNNWECQYKIKNNCLPDKTMKDIQKKFINKLFNLNNSGIDIDLPLQTFYK